MGARQLASDEFPGLAGVYQDPRDPNPRLLAWLSEWEDGQGRGSGAEIHQEGAHVFELRDGKIVRLEIFARPHPPSRR